MLIFGIAIAFALAAADRARRREASPFVWGLLTGVVCVFGAMFAARMLAGLFSLIVLVLLGAAMVFAAAKLGKTTRECPGCGKNTPIAALACPHCGASPRTSFTSRL